MKKVDGSSAMRFLNRGYQQALLACTALTLCSLVSAQDLLLTDRFSELCTMCEAWVLCTAEPADTVAQRAENLSQNPPEAFTLYRFKIKGFWGQIATIWNYYARLFDPVVSETRPAEIFRRAKGPDGSYFQTHQKVDAFLSLEAKTLELGGTRINRVDLTWSSTDGQSLGACARAPIRDAIEFKNGLAFAATEEAAASDTDGQFALVIILMMLLIFTAISVTVHRARVRLNAASLGSQGTTTEADSTHAPDIPSDRTDTAITQREASTIWSTQSLRKHPLRYLGRSVHLAFRYLFALFFGLAGINKLQSNWLFSDQLRIVYEERLTQLSPDGFAAWFLENIGVPLYLPIAWIVTWVEIVAAICLFMGLSVRPASAASFLLLLSFAVGGYYDASLLPFFLICIMFLSWPSGQWLGLDRRMRANYPDSIWFR